jgi:hypothetical protein
VRGWEGGILRFLAARFGEKAGFWGAVKEAVQVGTADSAPPSSMHPLLLRLSAACLLASWRRRLT